MSSETITRNDLTAILNEVLPNPSDMTPQEVEDFVDGLNISGINAVDYIVEQGTSGDWKYRVWASGKKEAWLHASLGALTFTKANYRNYLLYTYDTACPIEFTDPVISANARASSGSTRFENVGWTSANKLSGYFMTDTNATGSGTTSWNSVHLYAYIFE